MHPTFRTHITQVSHVLNSFHTLKSKSEPLYTTQYSDFFVTYQEGFRMHTAQPNPQSIKNEYISSNIVLDSTTKHCFSSTF